MSNNMSKWILAFCVAATAAMGCGMDPAEEAAAQETAAISAGAGGAGGVGAPDDVELTQESLTAVPLVRYIDYGALNGNRAPCPSNQIMDNYLHRCVPRPPVIYRRGCTAQTRCARG